MGHLFCKGVELSFSRSVPELVVYVVPVKSSNGTVVAWGFNAYPDYTTYSDCDPGYKNSGNIKYWVHNPWKDHYPGINMESHGHFYGSYS